MLLSLGHSVYLHVSIPRKPAFRETVPSAILPREEAGCLVLRQSSIDGRTPQRDRLQIAARAGKMKRRIKMKRRKRSTRKSKSRSTHP
jgi:hypothetical protein